jgi:hypothetical protein
MAKEKKFYEIEEIENVDTPKLTREDDIDDGEITDIKIRNVSFRKILSGIATNKVLQLINSTLSFASSVLSMISSTLLLVNSKLQLKDENTSTYTTDIEEKSDGTNIDLANAMVLSNKFTAGYVIIPKIGGTYDIGTALKAFKDIYASNNVVIGGKNAVKSGVAVDSNWTVNATTSVNGGLDPHSHTVALVFNTTSMIKDGVEYQVFKHT